MSNKSFQKFIDKKEKGSKKKERIRQEKKKIRQETKQYFEQKKLERKGQGTGYKVQGTRHTEQGSRHAEEGTRYKGQGTGFKKQGELEAGSRKQEAGSKKYDVRNSRPAFTKASVRKDPPGAARPETKSTNLKAAKKPQTSNLKLETRNAKPETHNAKPESVMPLNKFIAHAGICSRRDAANIVKSGKVTVNNQVVTEPGFKVSGKDEIKVNGKKISARKNLVYILLNKPKDFITTTEDPEGRKTVLDIVRNATPERVYPVGRLDRNTTGVLLLTNDGELAQKLSHPSYEIKKIYEVKLDKPVAKKDFETISKGLTLEDGFIAPDALAYADPKDKSVIGIEIHSGRNRIVRRIFEALGYDVRNLDRVMYANLTKKNVERGKWRFLNEKEVRLLKFLNASYTRK